MKKKLDQMTPRGSRRHRDDCRVIGAGGNSLTTRTVKPIEMQTVAECSFCAAAQAKP